MCPKNWSVSHGHPTQFWKKWKTRMKFLMLNFHPMLSNLKYQKGFGHLLAFAIINFEIALYNFTYQAVLRNNNSGLYYLFITIGFR